MYKRVRRLTLGINIKKHWLNKFYFATYMIRRAIFVYLPIVHKNYQGF